MSEFGKDFTFEISLYQKVFQRMPFPVLLARQFEQNPQTQVYSQASLAGKAMFENIKLEGVNLVIPPLITISGQKQVIKTPVAGRNYSVKEIISCQDWQLNIKGFAINAEVIEWSNEDFLVKIRKKEFPEQNLLELINLYKKNRSVKIESTITSLFGFDRIVIESLNFPEFEGLEDCFPFEINAISDIPLEVSLKNKDLLNTIVQNNNNNNLG